MTQVSSDDSSAWPIGAAACSKALPALQWICRAWQMPFDLLRAQHAQAIRAGMIEKSILESRDFEREVDALETLWLGPFARTV